MKSTLIYTSLFTVALGAPANFHMRRQNNFQTFSAALGGVEATPVVDSGNADRPFQVKGDTFVNIAAALARSCDQQFNGCANLANSGAAFSVNDCTAQKSQCSASVDASTAAPPAAPAPAASASATATATPAPAAGKGKAKACKAKQGLKGNGKNKQKQAEKVEAAPKGQDVKQKEDKMKAGKAKADKNKAEKDKAGKDKAAKDKAKACKAKKEKAAGKAKAENDKAQMEHIVIEAPAAEKETVAAPAHTMPAAIPVAVAPMHTMPAAAPVQTVPAVAPAHPMPAAAVQSVHVMEPATNFHY